MRDDLTDEVRDSLVNTLEKGGTVLFETDFFVEEDDE